MCWYVYTISMSATNYLMKGSNHGQVVYFKSVLATSFQISLTHVGHLKQIRETIQANETAIRRTHMEHQQIQKVASLSNWGSWQSQGSWSAHRGQSHSSQRLAPAATHQWVDQRRCRPHASHQCQSCPCLPGKPRKLWRKVYWQIVLNGRTCHEYLLSQGPTQCETIFSSLY